MISEDVAVLGAPCNDPDDVIGDREHKAQPKNQPEVQNLLLK